MISNELERLDFLIEELKCWGLYLFMRRERDQEEDITPSELGRRLLKDFRKEAMRNKFEARRKKYEMEEQKRLENIEEENVNKQEELPKTQKEYIAYLAKHDLNQHLNDLQLPNPQKEQQIPPKIYFQHNDLTIFDQILGKGSYGIVRSGINKHTGEKIAAKQMDYFQKNELKCLKELDSEYIIKIIDYFQYNQKCYIIFEYCQGNLKEELKKCNYDIEKALGYFEQIIHGIDLLQSKNIIHRDLKFQNILVKDGKAKISDFGLAKYLGNQLQVESRQCGTKYTMAPEIYFSNSKRAYYTRKTDIWAIGVMLHEMLYRMHPFRGMVDRLHKGARVPIQRKFGILDRMIDKCLAKRPSQRISWNELMNMFDQYTQTKRINEHKQIRNALTLMDKMKQQDHQKIIFHPKKQENKVYHSQGEHLRRDDQMNDRKQRSPFKINKENQKKYEQRRINEAFRREQRQNWKHYRRNRVHDMKNRHYGERQQQRPIEVDQLAVKPLKFHDLQAYPFQKYQIRQQFNQSQPSIPMHQVIILFLMILIAASVAVKVMVFLI